MEISYLKEFVHLAEVGNFLKASYDLFISQSSLSKHMKTLEDELNVVLMDRTTRAFGLTKEGQVFLPYAKEIVRQSDESTIALTKCLEEQGMSIHIGILSSVAEYNLTGIIYNFKKQYPKIKLELITGDTNELIPELEAGTIEIAFLRTRSNSPKKNGIRFISDKLVAVVPKNDPLASQKEIRIEDLKGKDLVMLEKGSFVYDIAEEACHKAGFDMRVLYSDKHISNIADFVTKGLGIALLMEGHTLLIRNPMIRTIPIVPQIDGDIQICWNKNSSLTPAARSFLTVVDDFVKNEEWKPDPNKPLFPPSDFGK